MYRVGNQKLHLWLLSIIQTSAIFGSPPCRYTVHFHPHTNLSSTYFQCMATSPFFKKATVTIWIKQQFHIYSIIYHAYFAASATVPAQYAYHKNACTICISQKKIETRTKTLKKRKWCRDGAHWQTKHRNKLHVGMVLTGIQSTETSCM